MKIYLLLLVQFTVGYIFSQNDSCSVQISIDTTIVPRQLIATATGTAPFLYEWNNGRQTDKITLNFNGDYVITITDATGCTSLGAFNYTQCSVTIVEDTTNNNLLLRAAVTGRLPFQYFWSDNSQSEVTTPNGTGNYSLTITDATGCVAAVDYEYIDRDSSNYLIEGRIRNRGNNRDILFEGTVFLYQKLSDIQYELVDSVSFGSEGAWSPFSFGEVDAGIYILQAVLRADSDGYKEFSPTYYGPSIRWQNARLLHIPYSGTRSADMGMYSLKILDGEGLISGSVTEEENFQIQSGSRNQGNLSGYQILLLDETGKVFGSTNTNESGRFSFENLAFGNYKILVEKVGYSTEIIEVVLNEAITNKTNLQFTVDLMNKSITDQTSTTSLAEQAVYDIRIFPNPSHSSIFIESRHKILQVQLVNVLGLPMRVERDKGKLDIAHLANGIYWVSIQTKYYTLTSKIIVKH